MTRLKHACVFCGSAAGKNPKYSQAALNLGQLLAEKSVGLVYGGGNTGMMGAIANAVMEHGGQAIGVIPRLLVEKEVAHLGITELRVVETMHERKAMMAELSDAFVTLPGGFGTFEELFEIITWTQLGIYHKPCAILNVDGYYDPLVRLIEHGVSEKFIRLDMAQRIIFAREPSELISKLENWRAPDRPVQLTSKQI